MPYLYPLRGVETSSLATVRQNFGPFTGAAAAGSWVSDHCMRTPEEEEEDFFFWSFTTIKQQPACLDYEQRRRLRPISLSKIHHLGLKDNKKSVKR